MGELVSLTEWCSIHGKDKSVALRLIRQGRLPEARKLGSQWVIPADVAPPADARVKSGKYRDWRKPKKEEEKKPYVYIPEG